MAGNINSQVDTVMIKMPKTIELQCDQLENQLKVK